MKIKRLQYAENEKKSDKVAWPIRKILLPNSHVKNPLNPRNKAKRTYAISESKNEFSSRFVIIQIGSILIKILRGLSLTLSFGEGISRRRLFFL
jgi:hypothetical protein